MNSKYLFISVKPFKKDLEIIVNWYINLCFLIYVKLTVRNNDLFNWDKTFKNVSIFNISIDF